MIHKRWYTMPVAGDRQGLVVDEADGSNVAVVYDPKDAVLLSLAPRMLAVSIAVLNKLEGHERRTGVKQFATVWDELRSIISEAREAGEDCDYEDESVHTTTGVADMFPDLWGGVRRLAELLRASSHWVAVTTRGERVAVDSVEPGNAVQISPEFTFSLLASAVDKPISLAGCELVHTVKAFVDPEGFTYHIRGEEVFVEPPTDHTP